jgi:hypothetical protein
MTSKIIIGITTTPVRLNNMGKMLMSLFRQTKKPDEIVLTIPVVSARFGIPYQITDNFLLRLIEVKKVVLNTIMDDYGPATKFIGLLLRNYNPDDILIWVDDDIEYASNVVEYLTTYLKPYTSIGLSGFNFNKDGNYNKVNRHLHHAEVIEGFSGVASYKKNMPDIIDFNKYDIRPQTNASLKTINNIEKAQFLSDDYIISTYFKLKGIATLVCCVKECHFGNCVNVLDMGNRSDALHNLNSKGNMYNYNLLRGFIKE